MSKKITLFNNINEVIDELCLITFNVNTSIPTKEHYKNESKSKIINLIEDFIEYNNNTKDILVSTRYFQKKKRLKRTKTQKTTL